jgi:hypothetical protein
VAPQLQGLVDRRRIAVAASNAKCHLDAPRDSTMFRKPLLERDFSVEETSSFSPSVRRSICQTRSLSGGIRLELSEDFVRARFGPRRVSREGSGRRRRV